MKTQIDYSPMALRAFARIARAWRLDEREQRCMLGNPKPMTMERWLYAAKMRKPVKIPDAALIRISQVMLIEQRIKKALPDPDDQAAWIRASNKALDGHKPLLLMCHTAQSLARVSKALERARYN